MTAVPQQKKVLIVEDDGFLAKLYIKEFESSGYSVVYAENGEKGLALALAEKPHIIILDIALPKMQGTDMMKMLRKDVWGATVPIIIVTNLTIGDDIIRDVVEGQPSYVLTKSDTTPSDILMRSNQILAEMAAAK